MTPSPRAKPPSAKRQGTDRPQVGRRPSSPTYLLVVAVVWIGCGVYAYFGLAASWRLVPAIFFVGVGLFFLRGAAATVLRRSPPEDDQ